MIGKILFVAVIAVAVTSVFPADTCSSSDRSKIQSCYANFVGAYGFSYPTNGLIPEYWLVHKVRENWLFSKGVTVQPQVCEIGNDLVNCLKPFSCLSAATMTFLGANATDSPNWILDKAVTEFQCGVGYRTAMSDFYCLAACREHKGAEVQACTDRRDAAINNGTNPCVALSTWILCQGNVYSGYCDANAGAFFCGVDRAGILATDKTCDTLGLLAKCPPFRN